MITGHLEEATASSGKPYWRIRLDYGPDPLTGKRHQPRLEKRYSTQRAAKRDLDRELQERNHSPLVLPSKRTVHTVLVDWLEKEAKSVVRVKTFADYESTVRNHIDPALGHLTLQQLTTALVQEFRAKLLSDGKSTWTASKATLHLSQALAYGVRQGYLTHNPARGIRRLHVPHKEMKVWTAEQASAFLQAARGATYDPLWLIALSCGLRMSELRSLCWSDVDLESGVLSVRRSLDQYGTINGPKSNRARTIDLDKPCVKALKDYRARQGRKRMKLGPAWEQEDLLFSSDVGTPICPRNLYRAMDAIRATCGVPDIRFHDMRHTSATLMLQAGVPVKVVSERLGHANVTITLNIYAHVLPGMQRQAAETLGRLLSSNG